MKWKINNKKVENGKFIKITQHSPEQWMVQWKQKAKIWNILQTNSNEKNQNLGNTVKAVWKESSVVIST